MYVARSPMHRPARLLLTGTPACRGQAIVAQVEPQRILVDEERRGLICRETNQQERVRFFNPKLRTPKWQCATTEFQIHSDYYFVVSGSMYSKS